MYHIADYPTPQGQLCARCDTVLANRAPFFAVGEGVSKVRLDGMVKITSVTQDGSAKENRVYCMGPSAKKG